MKKTNITKAYKVFDPDWKCKGFQYEVGKTYTTDIEPIMCERGFHACQKVSDCFNYYQFDPNNKVAEVELFGTVLGLDSDKQCANNITIVKEVSWAEMLVLANSGIGNSGNRNSGNRNSGNSNSGNRNSGDWNSGNSNSGDWNSGDWNSGNSNSGNRNSGNRNSGDWNSGNRNSGFFNSTTPDKIRIFNKYISKEKWDNADKPYFINIVKLTEWISFNSMTDVEKKEYPNAFVCDGYLKVIDYKDAWKIAFESANENDITLLKALPGFNKNVFYEITGIKL
jgi:hypothetical protein